MAGGSAGFAERMCTAPRLSGRRFATLAVKAGNGSSLPPHAARLSGWIWYSRLAVAKRGLDLAKMPSWLGAIDIGPDRASRYSRPIMAFPNRVPARVFSVAAPVIL